MNNNAVRKHVINNAVDFSEGRGGFTVAQLTSNSGNRCEVYLHGGHVSSLNLGGAEILWMSPDAVFATGCAIRGGVPVCWPWFGPHATDTSMPSHGFARNRVWTISDTWTEGNDVGIRLLLVSDEQTLELFEHEFELSLQITLNDRLEMQLTAANPTAEPYSVGGALHSYFAVDNIDTVRLGGLDGVGFLDQLDGMNRSKQTGDVQFDCEVDRVYVDSEHDVTIETDKRILVSKSGSASTVVWNPWIDKTARIADLPNDAYQSFVCVETANAFDDMRTLPAGGSHTMSQTIAVIG